MRKTSIIVSFAAVASIIGVEKDGRLAFALVPTGSESLLFGALFINMISVMQKNVFKMHKCLINMA